MNKFKRADLFAVVAILALAAAILYSGARGAEGQVMAVIKQNNIIERQISLDESATFTLGNEGRYNEIEVENGEIAFVRASCKHQTCVQTGRISRAGQTAVCLENRVSITIEGRDAPDAIAK